MRISSLNLLDSSIRVLTGRPETTRSAHVSGQAIDRGASFPKWRFSQLCLAQPPSQLLGLGTQILPSAFIKLQLRIDFCFQYQVSQIGCGQNTPYSKCGEQSCLIYSFSYQDSSPLVLDNDTIHCPFCQEKQHRPCTPCRIHICRVFHISLTSKIYSPVIR